MPAYEIDVEVRLKYKHRFVAENENDAVSYTEEMTLDDLRDDEMKQDDWDFGKMEEV